MSWIFKLIPFPFLILVAGLGAAACTAALVFFEDQKQTAREAGMPAAISATALEDVKGFPWYDEVAVRVQMHEDMSYVYWEDGYEGGIEYPVLFFFDPAQSGPVREVLGAIAFDSYDAEDMLAYLESVRVSDVGNGAFGGTFELAGVPPLFPYVTHDEVKWAAEDLGVTMSQNFVYLDPYFLGRDTRVAARPMLMYITASAAVLLIWLSMVAAIIRRRWRRSDEATSLQGVAKKGLVAAAFGGAKALMSEEEDGNYI